MKDVTIETNKGKENRYIISSFFHGMVVVCKGSRTVLDSGLYAMDSGSWIPYSESRLVPDFWQWNSGFQSLMGFRIPQTVFQIPKPRI